MMLSQTLYNFDVDNRWNNITLEDFKLSQGDKYPLYSRNTPIISTGKAFTLKFTLTFKALPPDFSQKIISYIKDNFNIRSHQYIPIDASVKVLDSKYLNQIFLKDLSLVNLLVKVNKVYCKIDNIKIPDKYSYSKTSLFYSLHFGNDCLQSNLVLMTRYYYGLLNKEILKDFTLAEWHKMAEEIDWLNTYLARKELNPWSSLLHYNSQLLIHLLNDCKYTVHAYREAGKSNFSVNFFLCNKSEEMIQQKKDLMKSNFCLLEHSKEGLTSEVQFSADTIFMIFREGDPRNGFIQLLISFSNLIGDDKYYSLEIFGKKILEFYYVLPDNDKLMIQNVSEGR